MPDPKRINIQQLLVLEALVRERHVSRAAEAMGVGQPAMSTALARMRALLGDPLLVKTSRGMEPTARAIAIVQQARGLREVLQGRVGHGEPFEAATSRARFNILASDGLAAVLLPELMRAAGAQAPGMQFLVQPGDIRRAAEYLRDGEQDLVIGPLLQPPADLRHRVLFPQQLVCIARKGHPGIGGRLTLRQYLSLQHATWGGPPVPYPTMEAQVDEALRALGHERRIALRVAHITLLARIVAGCDLIAVVSSRLAQASAAVLEIQVHPLPFHVSRLNTSLFWHERLHQDPAHRWLRDTLSTIARHVSRNPNPRGA